jgi:hypothetical protein
MTAMGEDLAQPVERTGPDVYAGVDLLADVFEGTEDAPVPLDRRDAGGNLVRLWPSPDDPRWAADMAFYPDGKLMAVRSIRPRV